MSLIEVRNLTHIYTTKNENGTIISEKTALNHLDFTVDEGEFVAILGANGSGKTTLARQLNALLTPTEGSVRIDGKNTVNAAELYAIRSTVGMVFQNPDNQMVAQLLEDEVAFGPENLGLSTDEIRSRVDEALKEVGLAERKHFMVQYLSGGQKQLAAIAGVLAMQPKCVVLDEATSMLDPQGRREVLRAVGKLRRKKQIAIVMITHDVEEALLADRVCVMDLGRIVLSGRPEDVFREEDQIRKYGLELPQAAELAREFRCKGIPVRPGVMTEVELRRELARLIQDDSAGSVPGELPDRGRTDRKEIEKISGIAENNLNVQKAWSVDSEDRIRVSQISADLGKGTHGRKILSLAHVTQRYFGGTDMQVDALKDVNLSVHAGEFVAVIGQTGSGKSTLLDLLGGLIKPTEGTLQVFETSGESTAGENSSGKNGTETGEKTGKNLRRKKSRNKGKNTERVRGKRTGIVFQYPDHQLFEETVLKDVMFGPGNLGIVPEQAESLARQALRTVMLPEETWDRSPLTLSGGEKRKAALAGVLAMEPEILLLDEPTAGLAQTDRTNLFHMLREEYQKKGKTVLFTTHHMEDAAEFADRVIVLHEGSVACDGTAKEVFQHRDELCEIGLEVPLRIRIEEEFPLYLQESDCIPE